MIEVDVYEGEQRMAKPGALKAEAKTISHLLTHRYRNPYCQSCVRAKMKHFRTKTGAFKRELKKWGDLITFDCADLEWTDYMAVLDDRELLVIRDRFTGIIEAFPLKGKATEEIVLSIKRFIGSRKVTLAFSDQAPQFVKACKELKIPLDTSVPGRNVTNSLAGRNIQFLAGATAKLDCLHAIGPLQSLVAVTCVSHLLNIEDLDENFKGPKIQLGAKVIFKPSDARDREQDTKFHPKGLYGVFAGCVIESGNKWSRRMLVWNLQDFAKVNLAFDCEKVPLSLQRPHVTERVELELPINFPLQGEFEKLNGTLEGMNIITDRHGRPDVDDMIEDDRDDGEEDYSPEPLWDENQDDDHDEEGGRSSDKKTETIEHHVHHPVHHTYGAAGDGIIYHDDEGHWVKLDRLGKPYRVDRRDGRRVVKTTRPKEFTPEEWKSLGHEQHRKALAEEFKTAGIESPNHDEDPEKEDAERDKRSKKKKKRGESAGQDDKDEDDDKIDKPDEPPDKVAVSRWLTSEQRIVDAVSSGCSEGSGHFPNHTIDENNNWIEWEEFVSNVNPASASVSIPQIALPSDVENKRHGQDIPSMRCIHHLKDDHRMRLGETFVGTFSITHLFPDL